MRILHVFDHSLPLHSGYSFRSRSILLEQRKLGWETHHLTTPRHYHPGPIREEVGELCFHRTIKPTGALSQISPFAELAEVQATIKQLEKLALQVKPDIIHAHSPVLAGLAAQRVAQRLKVPMVYEIRAFWEDAAVAHGSCAEQGARYRAIRFLETFVAQRADAVAAICVGLLTELKERGVAANKLFQIPNAVDLDKFVMDTPRDTALAETLGLQDAEIIGFIGSFYDYEGLDVLLRAMPELLTRRPNLHLLLVGGGPVEAQLKEQMRGLNISSRVHFVGRVSHHEVERYYSLIDVLVYPRKKMRLTELVTPLKPLEAMAGGKIVAASNVGGHRELIQDERTGILFSADDPRSLAARVSGLFDRKEEWGELRKTARRYVGEERSWARSVSNYVPVYARLVGNRLAPEVPKDQG